MSQTQKEIEKQAKLARKAERELKRQKRKREAEEGNVTVTVPNIQPNIQPETPGNPETSANPDIPSDDVVIPSDDVVIPPSDVIPVKTIRNKRSKKVDNNGESIGESLLLDEISDLEKSVNLLISSFEANDAQQAIVFCQAIKMTCAIVFTDDSESGVIKKSPFSFDEYCNKKVTKQELQWNGMKPYVVAWLDWLLKTDLVDPSRNYLKLFLTFFPRMRLQLMEQ